MKPLQLSEHKDCTASLSSEEVVTLRRYFSKQLEVWPTADAGTYLLKAGSYAGVIVLPTGRIITINPKTSIPTLFALLAKVYDPEKQVFSDQSCPYSMVSDLFEFVVSFFSSHVEDLIARGLLRGYQTEKEDMQAIRGRLLINETIHHRPGLYDRYWCSFRNFTLDIFENRILLWTAHCLQFWQYKESDLPARLYRIQQIMEDVHLDPNARQLYHRLEYHRLNDFYQPALTLAKLLLDHLTFSGSAGNEDFLAYLIDMNVLFQDYLTVVLQQEVKKSGYTLRAKEHHPLDWENRIPIEPDYVLYSGQRICLILDAKYKLGANREDIYQMISYCHILGQNQAILIHPASELVPESLLCIRGAENISIHYLQIDLSGEPQQLDEQSHDLAQKIMSIVNSHKTVTPIQGIQGHSLWQTSR